MPDDTTPAEALPEPPAPRPPTPPGMLRVRPLGTACVPRQDASDRNAGSRARGLFVGRAPQASKGVPPALPRVSNRSGLSDHSPRPLTPPPGGDGLPVKTVTQRSGAVPNHYYGFSKG